MKRRYRLPLTAIAVLALLAGPAVGQGTPMFGGFAAESNDPISINAETLQWTQRDGRQILEYRGGVVATRGDMTIRASVLTVFLPLEGTAGGGTFDRIEASGNVSIVASEQNASAQNAVMDMVGQTVVMTGNVSLNDGVNQMSGERLTVDLRTGNWQMEAGAGNRVQTVVNPAR